MAGTNFLLSKTQNSADVEIYLSLKTPCSSPYWGE